MYKKLARYTLLWSFVLGALIAVYLHKNKNSEKNKIVDNYEKWFRENELKRTHLTMDYILYGNYNKNNLESKFLYNKINLRCIILVRKRKNAIAANNTWAQHCNDQKFIYLQTEKVQKTKLPIRQTKIDSSWHILCDAIRNMDNSFHWALFLNDDTFALAENVRRMVASLDYNKGHYLGHAINFWGSDYNSAQAGYVLSKGSVLLLKNKFNSTENCAAGGRFWKQEDYYLGKHLADLGVYPVDTRDHFGKTTFHGHNLAQLLSPDSFAALQVTNFYSKNIFPANKCCSSFAVTFQTVEADKMYTNHYLLYGLQVFYSGGKFGNHKPQYLEDDKVWRAFVSEQRKLPELFKGEMSAETYYDLWKSIVNDPMNFNQNIRKWRASESKISNSAD